MNKLILFSVLLICVLSSCSKKYKITGESSISKLDGRMLFIKVIKNGTLVDIDSAEVIHGLFKMKGKIDSVQMATLFMEDVSIMPLVLEGGNIKVSITNTTLEAKGTPLNDRLYSFIETRNMLEASVNDLGSKEARMILDGKDPVTVHEQVVKEGDSLTNVLNKQVKDFFNENYENVLGPSVFMMLCSSMPYPIMTPQIDEIMKDAPYTFKNDPSVKDFLNKAKENMELIKEHQRLNANTASN